MRVSRFYFTVIIMSTLYVVATPIGNLKDITLRALEVLKEVDLILAEDTRVTKKLLSHYEISKQVISYHEYSGKGMEEKILKFLGEGKNLALVVDAGTPGISDPGQRLIKRLATEGVEILPIPGPSALSAIVSVSDINLSEFLFLGFPPHKKGRQKFFKKVAESAVPVVLYESTHRIIKTLKELQGACGDRYANIGRELTKVYEEIFRGKFSEAEGHFVGEKVRGEFVIVIDTK